MKRQALSLVSLLSLLLVAGSAFAQSIHLRADVPFNFAVGKKSLSAGKYNISTLAESMILLRGPDSGSNALVATNCAERSPRASGDGKLVFRRYGNHYFLAEIWEGGSNLGREVPKGKAEKEMAATLTPSSVEIVASLY